MRSLETAVSNALVANVVKGIYFVRLNFDEGAVGWHTSFGDITYDGLTYKGVGALSSISSIKEESGVKASGCNVGISGIKEEIVALFVGTNYINRKAFIFFLPLDEQDRPVSITPKLLFRGSMDNISGVMGRNAGFSVTLKSRFADWERPRKILYTDVMQQKLYPGDLGMEFIAQLSQKKVIWPRAAFLPDPRD